MNIGRELRFENWLRASYPRNPTKKNGNGNGTGGVKEKRHQTQDNRNVKRDEHKLLLTYTKKFYKVRN